MGKRVDKNMTRILVGSCLILLCCSSSVLAADMDYSGTYSCELQGDANFVGYMLINQTGTDVEVTFSWDCKPYQGTATENVLYFILGDSGTMTIIFSIDGQTFSGTWQYGGDSGTITGNKVADEEWPGTKCYDVDANGVPKFVENDFTELTKISEISRFRSATGHDYSDGFESCRSMKHYYAPFDTYKENHNIEVYSPVDGVIDTIRNEKHGSSTGLNNKQIWIKSNEQPAFTFVIFHTDLISSDIAEGTPVPAGWLLGHARMYYPDLNEYAHSFDIAVWVNTPTGTKYISYFETMTATVFDQYIARGVRSRYDFIITEAERDADPLTCDGEQFLDSGNLDSWVMLSFTNGCDFCGPNFGPPDGAVDIWDLTYLVDRWLQVDCDATGWCDGTDFDHNKTVDFIDFGTFARHWKRE